MEQCALSARTNVSVVATAAGGWCISEMITVQRVGCCCVVVLLWHGIDVGVMDRVCSADRWCVHSPYEYDM
jgi:hypothetical protein